MFFTKNLIGTNKNLRDFESKESAFIQECLNKPECFGKPCLVNTKFNLMIDEKGVSIQ